MDDDLAVILINLEEQAEAPHDVMEERPMQSDENCMAIVLYSPGYVIPLIIPEMTVEEVVLKDEVEEKEIATETETADPSLSIFRNAIDTLKRLTTFGKRKDNNS